MSDSFDNFIERLADQPEDRPVEAFDNFQLPDMMIEGRTRQAETAPPNDAFPRDSQLPPELIQQADHEYLETVLEDMAAEQRLDPEIAEMPPEVPRPAEAAVQEPHEPLIPEVMEQPGESLTPPEIARQPSDEPLPVDIERMDTEAGVDVVVQHMAPDHSLEVEVASQMPEQPLHHDLPSGARSVFRDSPHPVERPRQTEPLLTSDGLAESLNTDLNMMADSVRNRAEDEVGLLADLIERRRVR